ncbi:MAG: UDP-N-acetylmuramoyl-tripeptide--D-alanyl-D-alanine ligase [Abditibacteriota bacterium]|nr:UDP-N-acetylmuramoyl-tripeptide--D-alanyl-D-alanine ligase [Abditibacteriota bacterium]
MSQSLPPINHAPFSLEEIAHATNGTLICGDLTLSLRGVATDTRAMPPADAPHGSLFVALRGEKFDGHQFLSTVGQSGARAALIEHEADAPAELALVRVQSTLNALGDLALAHRRRFTGPVVGVTGSYGKTTTRALIATALSAAQSTLDAPESASRVLETQGNFNNEIGVPLTLLGIDPAAHDFAVVELAMRGVGEIDYLAQITEPTIGVITNIGPQHIERLGGLDEIAAAKSEMLAHLPLDGIAILPADDKYFDWMKQRAQCRVVSFGTAETADYRVQNVRTSADGTIICELHTPHSSPLALQLPLPGAHNAINAAAAIAVACECGVDATLATSRLAHVEIPGARMRVVREERRDLIVIDDCYNAGPDSMRAALEVLWNTPSTRRRVAILGAMKELGDWAELEHRALGEAVASGAKVLLAVGPETLWTCAAASQEAPKLDVYWCQSAKGAADIANLVVRSGDAVLVKGSRSVGLEVVVEALLQNAAPASEEAP